MSKYFLLLFFLPNLLFAELNIAKKSPRIIKNKNFVIVIPSYNNEEFYEKNLRSVLSQQYTDYRVIYIDDASTDNTYQLVCNLLHEIDVDKRVTLIKNGENMKATFNFYQAISTLKSSDIVVSLDGDDFLHNDQVLNILNNYYQNEDVWMTYGSYIHYPSGEKGRWAQPVEVEALKTKNVRGHWQYLCGHFTQDYLNK